MPDEIITPAAILPITRKEAKQHLRIDDTADGTHPEDELIDTLILAATFFSQERTRRQFITATLQENLDGFPRFEIILTKPPLQSITSIKYFDLDNNQQTWSNALYEVDTKSEPGKVRPIESEVFPSTFLKYNAVEVLYKAGYGDTRATVPGIARSAIKLIISYLYEHRDLINISTSEAAEIPFPSAIELLLNQISLREFV